MKANTVLHKLSELITTLRSRCEGAEIYIDSLPQRRDKMRTVNNVNEPLVDFASDMECILIDNTNIKRKMLIYRKHFNKTGFFLLLANIRQGMFGKRSKILDFYVG